MEVRGRLFFSFHSPSASVGQVSAQIPYTHTLARRAEVDRLARAPHAMGRSLSATGICSGAKRADGHSAEPRYDAAESHLENATGLEFSPDGCWLRFGNSIRPLSL